MTRIRFFSFGIWVDACMLRKLGYWVQLSNGHLIERNRCKYNGGVLDGQAV
jgi:hypothetical protein